MLSQILTDFLVNYCFASLWPYKIIKVYTDKSLRSTREEVPTKIGPLLTWEYQGRNPMPNWRKGFVKNLSSVHMLGNPHRGEISPVLKKKPFGKVGSS